jgi:hypothetical protein
MRFRTSIELGGKTATGMAVPPEVVAGLGAGKRPAVVVTLNGHSYRSTIAPYGGSFMLPLSAENRERAGVAAGDEVEIEVELDTQPREVTMPADLAEALARDAEAKRAFEALSYSNQRRHVLSIEGARTPETRQRRVEKAIAGLREG